MFFKMTLHLYKMLKCCKIETCLYEFFFLYAAGYDGADNESFWWVDCEFLSFRDDTILVCCGLYQERPGRAPVASCSQLQGTTYVLQFTDRVSQYQFYILYFTTCLFVSYGITVTEVSYQVIPLKTFSIIMFQNVRE